MRYHPFSTCSLALLLSPLALLQVLLEMLLSNLLPSMLMRGIFPRAVFGLPHFPDAPESSHLQSNCICKTTVPSDARCAIVACDWWARSLDSFTQHSATI